MTDRELSVVVFGATGVTGRQVAAYLADRAEQSGARWAAAGRDPAKVERVLADIGVTAPEIVVADLEDREALEAMVARTRVVLNLAGPYTLYGEPVIEACIAAGSHYADVTGEMPFARRMIEAHQRQAKEAGVKIVNVSGFEALPADLAVLLAAETARNRWGEELVAVDLDVDMLPGGRKFDPSDFSGGTLQSMAEVIADEEAALTADPAALITEPKAAERVRRVSPITFAPRFNARGDVIAPMLPTPFINPAVIHRTAALLAAEEARAFEPFLYREGASVPGAFGLLPLRYAAAAAMAATDSAFRALARARPSIRRRAASLMRKTLPSSGFGPSGERLEAWTWQMAVNARTVGGHHVRIDVDGEGNPGYMSTPRMLGEAGLLLAEEGATPARAGFLTPATALGTGQLDRFRHARVRFQLSS